jgi:hypothetical protein
MTWSFFTVIFAKRVGSSKEDLSPKSLEGTLAKGDLGNNPSS